MKTEHDFNAWLKKEFKHFDEYKAVKISDRFKIGLPDWLIFHKGRAVAVECKFAKGMYTNSTKNLLVHSLKPPQITALKSFERVEVLPYILIGVGDTHDMWLGCYQELSPSGNVTQNILQASFKGFNKTQVGLMLDYMFDGPEALGAKRGE